MAGITESKSTTAATRELSDLGFRTAASGCRTRLSRRPSRAASTLLFVLVDGGLAAGTAPELAARALASIGLVFVAREQLVNADIDPREYVATMVPLAVV